MDDGQSAAVVAVGVCAYGMLYHVALEVGLLAELQHSVLCHRRRPHQFAAGEVIVGIGYQRAQVSDDVAHHRLVYLVGDVRRLRTAHVRLHAVGERVERTAYDLCHRQCLRQVAVQHGEGMIGAEQRLLQLLLLVGDDGAVVLLRARARCRAHGSHWHEIRRQTVVSVNFYGLAGIIRKNVIFSSIFAN